MLKIQNQKSVLSAKMHSAVCEDNINELLKQMRTNYGTDHKIWQDIVDLIASEEWDS